MSKHSLRRAACGALLGTVCLGLAVPAAADDIVWRRQFGTWLSEETLAAAPGPVGSVYVTGTTKGSYAAPIVGEADSWVVRYDQQGNQLWKRQFGTKLWDYPTGLAADGAGDVYVAGHSIFSGFFYGWVAKYSSAGAALWDVQLGRGNWVTDVATDPDGKVYLLDNVGDSTSDRNIRLIKYDPSGTEMWRTAFGTTGNSWNFAISLATDTAGDIYVAGSTSGRFAGANRGQDDAWVVKFDAAGREQWRRQLGTAAEDTAVAVATNPSGHLYVAGITTGSLAGANRGLKDAWVAMLDAAGKELWRRQIGTVADDEALSVATDAAGNAYLVGWTAGSLARSNQGMRDAWIAKLDDTGKLPWRLQLGTPGVDVAAGIAVNGDEAVYVAGNTGGPLAGFYRDRGDAWLMKLAPTN